MNWYKSGIYVQYGRVILMNSAMHEHRTCIINLLYGRTGNSIQQYMKSTKVLPTYLIPFHVSVVWTNTYVSSCQEWPP